MGMDCQASEVSDASQLTLFAFCCHVCIRKPWPGVDIYAVLQALRWVTKSSHHWPMWWLQSQSQIDLLRQAATHVLPDLCGLHVALQKMTSYGHVHAVGKN